MGLVVAGGHTHCYGPVTEIVADLKTRGSNAVIDDDFARDIEEGIQAQREPWNPPSWQ